MPGTKKHKYIIAILLIIIIIGLPLFLAIYEQLFLSYYQETIADRWANYLIYPLMALALAFWLVDKFRLYRKSEQKKLSRTLKKVLFEAMVIIILFMVVLKPVISGAIIIINTNIGKQTTKIIEGKVFSKIDYSSDRSHNYELTISSERETLVFQTDGIAITKYKRGDAFKETMKRGCLGLLYK